MDIWLADLPLHIVYCIAIVDETKTNNLVFSKHQFRSFPLLERLQASFAVLHDNIHMFLTSGLEHNLIGQWAMGNTFLISLRVGDNLVPGSIDGEFNGESPK